MAISVILDGFADGDFFLKCQTECMDRFLYAGLCVLQTGLRHNAWWRDCDGSKPAKFTYFELAFFTLL